MLISDAANNTDSHVLSVFEAVSMVVAEADGLFILSDDLGSIFRIPQINRWANSTLALVVDDALLPNGGDGQIAYDSVSDTLYTCHQKLDCILKV
jgi:hypothetical protein